MRFLGATLICIAVLYGVDAHFFRWPVHRLHGAGNFRHLTALVVIELSAHIKALRERCGIPAPLIQQTGFRSINSALRKGLPISPCTC
jgi:hypothetical protein